MTRLRRGLRRFLARIETGEVMLGPVLWVPDLAYDTAGYPQLSTDKTIVDN